MSTPVFTTSNEDARMSDTSPPSTPTYANNQILVDSPPPSQNAYRDTPPASGKILGSDVDGKAAKAERSFMSLNNQQLQRDQANAEERLTDTKFTLEKLGDPFDESAMYKD